MARPRGYLLNRPALLAYLDARRLSLTDAANACDLPLTTLSGLAAGNHRASPRTVRQIEDGLKVDGAAFFPELAGYSVTERQAVA